MNSQKQRRADRLRELRPQIFPKVKDSQLWDWRNAKGFAWIPRPLPVILVMIVELVGKNNRLSHAYLELFCQANEEALVELSTNASIAFHSGCRGKRGAKVAQEDSSRNLGFIKTKPGHDGQYSFALILPHHVIKSFLGGRANGLSEESQNALYARVHEVGANDLSDTKPGKRLV